MAEPAGRMRWTSGEFLHLPALPVPDPETTVVEPRPVAEDQRVCGRCGHPVGRGYAGRPGRTEGHCANCGARYAFLPKLAPGEVVEQRYEVLGCLPRGGQSWVYLARDNHLHSHVVLKGLINTGGAATAAAELSARERDTLTTLDHPNIVRIHNFVRHPDPDVRQDNEYIVMEHVSGLSLHELCQRVRERRAELPLEHALMYLLEVLAAFRYLHERGLLYCDLKPSNVIRGQDRIKLIDFGGVRLIGDRTGVLTYTEEFQVGAREWAATGLNVGSDLFAVGRTLGALFEVTPEGRALTQGDRPRGPLAHTVDSLLALLARAADEDPARRFDSAAELAGQLTGLLFEVQSLRDGQDRPLPSKLFRPSAQVLDAGLGAVPLLTVWSGPRPDPLAALDFGLPTLPEAASRLPVPRPDPLDPEAAFLSVVRADEPKALLAKLRTARQRTVGVLLADCRAQLELGQPEPAAESLAQAKDLDQRPAGANWRITWHAALVALARADLPAALACLREITGRLAGEDSVKLALGFCAEHRGDHAEAEGRYQAVWSRDRVRVSAAFGLARLRLRAGQRAEAVRVLDEVPQASLHHAAARIAGFRILCGTIGSAEPEAEQVREAAQRLPELYLDAGEPEGSGRARLTALVQEVALRGKDFSALGATEVLGPEPAEPALRRLLERSYRSLAGHAGTTAEVTRLVDQANRLRPKSWW
ncbi:MULTISPECIES: serine/threonine-protein kinase [unclassified Crossiella]|uniref:serine/threonine-protein kinase n=1 Tax=unclassified Crossiella TaxID=2620835 RepID=UPI001FFF1D24|nr:MULTISPECIES: serine/threonine-protein kinase [unclassified Crossiella]MCK2237298.1 serine/threonine-protein kinase PknG [Crossiella sp. S99.2]MCK2250953.1 serine/threonine-protein kinase PknG [Crossiella sp. S99.1]